MHHRAADFLLILLLLHVAAALKHQFVQKDGLLTRMSLFTQEGKLAQGLIPLLLCVCVVIASLIAFKQYSNKPPLLATAESQVTFTTTMSGQELQGVFADSQVEIQLDPAQPRTGSLTAIVRTASFRTGDAQVDASLPGSDWFDVETHPEASFVSESMQQGANGAILVKGALTIKGISQAVSFPMLVQTEDSSTQATGGFTINRLDFEIGAKDQPDDTYAGYNVVVDFLFKLD